MVFYCYVAWFSGHTFNSVCYFKFFCNMFCFQINTVVNVVIRLFTWFCDVICQEFFVMWFFHFVNVSCFICKNKHFFGWVDWSYVISKSFLKVIIYSSKLHFWDHLWRPSSNSIKSLCWGGHLRVLKPYLKVLSDSISKNRAFHRICMISSSTLLIRIFK